MTVCGFPYTVVGHQKHMNASKTSSKKLGIRKRVFLHPKPSDIENKNRTTEPRDKLTEN
jgi:hypothetical protein